MNKPETTRGLINLANQNKLLYRISNTLLKIDDLEKILVKAVEETLNATTALTVSVALFQEQKQSLVIKILRRRNGKTKPNQMKEFKLGEGLAGVAGKTREIVQAIDVQKSRDFVGNKKDKNFGIIAVPMLFQNELIGVLNLSTDMERQINRQEKEFLTVLATMIAGSVKNSQLYTKMSNQILNLSTLFGISSVINRQQTQMTIQKIVEAVPALFEAEKAHLLIHNSDKNSLQTYASSNIEKNQKLLEKELTLDQKSFSAKVFFSQKPSYLNNTIKNKTILPKYRKIFGIKNQLSVPVMASDRCIGVLHIINRKCGAFNNDDLKLSSVVALRIGNKIENSRLMKKAETEWDLFSNIIENVNEGVLVIDNKDNVKVWNKFLAKTFGIEGKDIVGHSGFELAKKIGTADLYWKILMSEKKRANVF